MYSKYNVVLDDIIKKCSFEELDEKGNNYYTEKENKIKNNLKRRLIDSNLLEKAIESSEPINVTDLKNEWFPEIRADIFLSHSHNDIDLVKKFAYIIKEVFNLEVFVDSMVWGYADELLKKIDDKYCKLADGVHYSYEKRNISTSHVHLILITSLLAMIDKIECLMFFNTSNSNQDDKTKSGWIYSEIMAADMIRRRKPERLTSLIEKSVPINEAALELSYPLELKDMKPLDARAFEKWIDKYQKNNKSKHALDVLYEVLK